MLESQIGSLQITDLEKNVNESELINQFGKRQDLISVKICRDFKTSKSLGQGYLNFKTFEEAERVIINENQALFNQRQVRLLWQVKDTNSINGNNLVVKGLPPGIDAADLQADFSIAGDIYSCKIPQSKQTDDQSTGQVCFFDEAGMQSAIEMFNNTQYEGTLISVSKFDNIKDDKHPKVQFKSAPRDSSEATIFNHFSEQGKVMNVKMEMDSTNKDSQFGQVSFEKEESVTCALNGSHGELVVKPQVDKRRDRKTSVENEPKQAPSKNSLYFKNISDAINEDFMRKEFEVQGEVEQLKIEQETVKKNEKEYRLSKGQGQVCYKNTQDAVSALENLSAKLIVGKPLQLSQLINKEQRKHMITAVLGGSKN